MLASLRISPSLALPAEDFIERATAFIAKRGKGKALALDTPLPTPSGWTTMSDVRLGDTLYDEHGKPCHVTGLFDVMHNRPCYRISFDDGSFIVADAEHEWLSETLAYRRALSLRRLNDRARGTKVKRTWPTPSLGPSILKTEEMRSSLHVGTRRERNHAIPCTWPLVGGEAALPLDPYVLGVWLGDGTTKTAEFTTMDSEVVAGLSAAGIRSSPAYQSGKATTYKMLGADGAKITSLLRGVGVLHNKHVPSAYLRASGPQRLQLLRGLMDTDGTGAASGEAIFYNMNPRLADAVEEIAVSLGWKVRRNLKAAKTNGKDCGTCHVVRFVPDAQVFTIPRKMERLRPMATQRGRHKRRMVASIEPVDSVPVRCISVDSPSHLYLAGKAMIPTHNSGGTKVIEEALLAAHLPFVVFDPVGIHWGLKSSFDGTKPSGHQVVVVGGEHGDLPLDRKSGRQVARTIADANVSLVIDFKGTPHAAYREFIADFADELLTANKHPRLLIFEEAPRLIPQRLRPDQTQCFDAVQRLVLEGRNMGLGCILVSQRAATLNKDVLTQVDNLVVMGITGPQDRKAVKEWVEENADPAKLDAFLSGLASLQPREAWLWAPDMGIFESFRFRDFTTFHPDRTHLRRMGLLATKPATTDVSRLVATLGAELSAIKEKAKLDDPAALRRRVKELEGKLHLTLQQNAPEVIERSALTKEDRRLMEEIATVLQRDEEGSKHAIQLAEHRLQQVREVAEKLQGALHPSRPHVGAPMREAPRHQPKAPPPEKARRAPVHLEDLSGPQQRLLDALAWLEGVRILEPRRSQLALAAEVSSKSSGFEKNVSTLSTKGLVAYPMDGHVSLTAAGRAAANPPAEAPTTQALQESLCRRVSGPQALLLRALIANYPEALSREELANSIPVSPLSSGFEKNISTLRSLGLIDYPRDGHVVANPVLFLE